MRPAPLPGRARRWLAARLELLRRLLSPPGDGAIRTALARAARASCLKLGRSSWVASTYAVEAWGENHMPLRPVHAVVEKGLEQFLSELAIQEKWTTRGPMRVRLRLRETSPRPGAGPRGVHVRVLLSGRGAEKVGESDVPSDR